ncbi:MAG: hypothetical protein ABID38_05630 [Candidatus Diapherotrites archaeon]
MKKLLIVLLVVTLLLSGCSFAPPEENLREQADFMHAEVVQNLYASMLESISENKEESLARLDEFNRLQETTSSKELDIDIFSAQIAVISNNALEENIIWFKEKDNENYGKLIESSTDNELIKYNAAAIQSITIYGFVVLLQVISIVDFTNFTDSLGEVDDYKSEIENASSEKISAANEIVATDWDGLKAKIKKRFCEEALEITLNERELPGVISAAGGTISDGARSIDEYFSIVSKHENFKEENRIECKKLIEEYFSYLADKYRNIDGNQNPEKKWYYAKVINSIKELPED